MQILKEFQNVEKKRLMTFKVSEAEYNEIKRKSIEYTGGRFSTWVRYAAAKHIPPKSELVVIDDNDKE